MTQIGSYAANQFVFRNNAEAQTKARDLRIQVASGQKAQSYSGIAADTRRLEGLENQHAGNKGFIQNIARSELRLQTVEGAVGGLQEIAKDFRTTLLSAANQGNVDNVDLGPIAEQLRDEAVALMNTEAEGRYLFAGSATDTAPVTLTDGGSAITAADIENGDKYYRGNGDELSVRAAAGVTMDYGVTADPGAGNGFQDLLVALSEVVENPQNVDKIDKAIDKLAGEGGAIAKLADTRAQIGSTLDVLDGVRNRLEDTQVDIESDIADIENVDVSRAMTLLSQQQTTLETSFAVTARLARTSLLNYL